MILIKLGLMLAICVMLYKGIAEKSALFIMISLGLNLVLFAVWSKGRKKAVSQAVGQLLEEHSSTPFDKERDEYDFFISYKSQNADTARYIAEQLISRGNTVWFAEYAILFKGRSDAEIEAAIKAGISASKQAVIIINDSYATAKWCELEIRNILEHISPQNIVAIDMPREDQPRLFYPALKDIKACEYTRDEDAFRFVADNLSVHPGGIDQAGLGERGKELVYTGHCAGHEYTINLGRNWRLIAPGEETDAGDVRAVEFQYDAPCLIKMNIYAGREHDPDARETRMKPDPSNRAMYRTLLEQAEYHVVKIGARPRGVHLLFHSQCSQIAFSYWKNPYWGRKYSIILLHSESGDIVEFVLTFGVFSSFADFCRFVFIMDRAVKTLQWR